MKITRTLALIATSTLLLAACNSESETAAEGVAGSSKNANNPLLAYVPADTAYLVADLEPIPESITDAYIARFQPVLDVVASQVEQFKTDYAAGDYEGNNMAKLGSALLDELGGELNKEGLANIGLSLQAHHAVYAAGLFPVMRIELTDAGAFRAAIGRVEAEMGIEMPQQDFNGKPYWKVSEDDMPVAVYIAILDNQLAVSLFPLAAEGELLASFMGQEMPAESAASSNSLAKLNKQKGYSNYGSGYLDFQKISNELLDTNSKTRAYIGPGSELNIEAPSEICIAEYKAMIARTPRLTGGMTSISNNEMSLRYELEIESVLARGLAALVSNTPTAQDGDHLVSGSLALMVGKVRSFVIEKAQQVVAAPYQCENLHQLNKGAADMVAQLNIPMPPMVNNLMGVRLELEDYDPSGDPMKSRAMMALHVDKPEMFVGMASMMLPGFDELDLAGQSDPVKIPAELMKVDGLVAYGLMSDSAIGVSLGDGKQNQLDSFLNAEPQDGGTFFSVSYDMAKQMKIQDAMSQQWGLDAYDNNSQVHELADAIKASYSSILGTSRIDVSFNGSGLVLDSRMNFK